MPLVSKLLPYKGNKCDEPFTSIPVSTSLHPFLAATHPEAAQHLLGTPYLAVQHPRYVVLEVSSSIWIKRGELLAVKSGVCVLRRAVTNVNT